jgi:hypothetical protein
MCLGLGRLCLEHSRQRGLNLRIPMGQLQPLHALKQVTFNQVSIIGKCGLNIRFQMSQNHAHKEVILEKKKKVSRTVAVLAEAYRGPLFIYSFLGAHVSPKGQLPKQSVDGSGAFHRSVSMALVTFPFLSVELLLLERVSMRK